MVVSQQVVVGVGADASGERGECPGGARGGECEGLRCGQRCADIQSGANCGNVAQANETGGPALLLYAAVAQEGQWMSADLPEVGMQVPRLLAAMMAVWQFHIELLRQCSRSFVMEHRSFTLENHKTN